MERRVESEAYAWGRSPLSRNIAEGFDEITKINDFTARQEQASYWTGVLYTHLMREVPINVLQHIKFDVVRAKSAETDPEDPKLKEIKHKLVDEFGHEVVRRVNITISKTPVPHNLPLSQVII